MAEVVVIWEVFGFKMAPHNMEMLVEMMTLKRRY